MCTEEDRVTRAELLWSLLREGPATRAQLLAAGPRWAHSDGLGSRGRGALADLLCPTSVTHPERKAH